MAIARIPESNENAIDKKAKKKVDDFINGASVEPKKKRDVKVPLMIRLDRSILDEIDKICEAKGMKRSPWIQYQLSEILRRGEIK